MDRIGLSRWIVLVLYACSHLPSSSATLSSVNDDSVSVSSLVSKFELQLQDATFDLLERYESSKLSRKTSNIRRKRDGETTHRTAFVTRLHHHREQLEIDQINATLVSDWRCQNAKVVRFDAAYYRRKSYAFSICDDLLSLYEVMESSVKLLQIYSLKTEALALSHVKLYDQVKDHVELYLLILTSTSFDVYVLENDEMEFIYSQPLTKNYLPVVSVFYVETDVYYMLGKVESDDSTVIGIFKLQLSDSEFKADRVVTKSLHDASMVRMCVGGDSHSYLFVGAKGRHRLDVYQFDAHKLVYHQKIEKEILSEVEDVSCFRMGATYYAALVTSGTLKIFQHVDSFYEFHNDVGLRGLTSVLPVSTETYRDEAILLVQGVEPDSNEKFVNLLAIDAESLHYKKAIGSTCKRPVDTWSASEARSYDAKSEGLSCLIRDVVPDWNSLATGLVVNRNPSWIVPFDVDNTKKLVMITLGAHLEPVESPVLQQKHKVQQRVKEYEDKLKDIRNRSTQFESILPNLILHDSDVRLNGTSWKAGTLHVAKLTVPKEESKSSRNIEFNREDWQPLISVTIDHVRNQVDQLERLIDSMEKRMAGVVTNGTTESVQLKELVINGSTEIQSLQVDNLTLDQLNGQSFSTAVNDTVRRDSDRLIESIKTLNGKLKTEALTADTVNGVRVEDIVTTDCAARLNGNIQVVGPAKIRDLKVGGKLAGIDVSEQLLTSEERHPSLRFTDPVTVDKLIILGRVNGMVGNEEFFDSILVDGSAEVQLGEARFDNLVVNGDLNVNSQRICGLNLSDLKNIVRVDADDQVITGNKEFTGGVTMESSLNASLLNDLKIPEDLVYRDQNATLTMKKTFQGPVDVASVIVNGQVNDHRIQDAVKLGSDQEITEAVVFEQGFDVTNDLELKSLNGNNYNSLMNVGVHPTLARSTNRTVRFKQPVRINGTLDIASTVNDVPLKALTEDILYYDETTPVVTGQKKLNSLTLNNLEPAGLVNGLNVTEDFLTRSTDQLITGTYEFGGPVELEMLNAARVNEYDIDDLIGNLVRLEGDQELSSQLNFEKVIVDAELEVDGSINGINVSKILTDGSEQHFTAKQTLLDPKFDSISIAGNLKSHDATVNGINLNEWNQRRVTLSTNQNITGNWEIDRVELLKSNFETLNQLPMEEWADTFIRKNGNSQVIEGNLLVDKLQVTGDVNTRDGVNGFQRLDEIAEKALDTRESIVLNGEVHFERLVSLDGNTIVDQLVNNVDLKFMNADAVFSDDPKPVVGTKVFSTSIEIAGNLNANNVNGGRLSNQYLHVSRDQVIESPIQFDAPVVTQDIRLNEFATFNGLHSDSLFSPDALSDNIHHGNAAFRNPIDVNELITNSINGNNWDQLLNSLALSNQSNSFPHSVKFKDLTIDGAINVSELNGIDPTKWAEDLVFFDADATISGPKKFDDLLVPSLHSSEIQSGTTLPDLTSQVGGAIRLAGDEAIDFKVNFAEVEVTGDVQIGGLINGNNFPDDYITLKGQQHLPGEYSINHLVSNDQIELTEGGTVNGLNLASLFNDSWMLDRPTRLEGKKIFAGPVQILGSDLNVMRTVNGFDLSEEAVSLQNDSLIYGTPIFRELNVVGNINNAGLTNDMNISALASRALYVDEPIVSSGRWKVGNKVSVEGDEFLLTKTAQLNGHQIKDLIDSPESKSEEDGEELVKDRRLFDVAKNWYDALRGAYFKLNYFEVNQTIDLRFPITSMLNIPLDDDTSVLLVGTQHCSSIIYSKSATENIYEFKAITSSQTNSVSKWISLQIKDSVAYVASLSTMTSSCRQNSAKLWRIGKDSLQLDLVQDLGRNVVDVASSSGPNDALLVYTVGDVLKQWAFSSRNMTQISSKVLSNSSSINLLNGENQNGVPLSSFNVRTHRFNVGEDQLVAVLEPVESSVSGCSGVKIHRYHNDQHLLEHVIPACGVQKMITFTLGNLPDYFVVLAERSWVGVYQYQGSSGFVRKTTLPIPSAQSLQWIKRRDEYFLAVGKQGAIVIYKAITLGHFVEN